jgi:hypothetical protein
MVKFLRECSESRISKNKYEERGIYYMKTLMSIACSGVAREQSAEHKLPEWGSLYFLM